MITKRKVEDPGIVISIPTRRSHTFVEIDHEIFLRSFSSFRCFKKRLLSVTIERMCVAQSTGYCVVRLTDRLDMTTAVDWDVKQQTKPNVIILDFVVKKNPMYSGLAKETK